MRSSRVPLAVAPLVSLLPSDFLNLGFAGLKSVGGSGDLCVESTAQLADLGLSSVLTLPLLVNADLTDPVILQAAKDAHQDHQQRHEEPQHRSSAADLIRVHHFLP